MVEAMMEAEVVVRCAACEATRQLALATLEVQALGATAMVALPPCGCGAVEYLIRSGVEEHPAPGTDGHRHQLLVDHLHAEVAARGRVAGDPEVARACPPVLPAVLARWFPQGLCLAGVPESGDR